MKKLLGAIVLIMPVATWADSASMYGTEEEFVADLEQFSVRCAAMEDGDVVDEIFGIQFVRDGERCVLGPGEIDPMAIAYFAKNEIDWAGLDGLSAIWVKPR